MVDIIDFGRTAANVGLDIRRIDVVGVGVGIIVVEFFENLAVLLMSLIQIFLIDPVVGVGEFLALLIDRVLGGLAAILANAFGISAQAAVDLAPIAMIVGLLVVLVSLFIIAQASDVL